MGREYVERKGKRDRENVKRKELRKSKNGKKGKEVERKYMKLQNVRDKMI